MVWVADAATPGGRDINRERRSGATSRARPHAQLPTIGAPRLSTIIKYTKVQSVKIESFVRLLTSARIEAGAGL
jgi:hypothetical protein